MATVGPASRRRSDRQIDRLVYELYGLTDADIAIVEGAAGRAQFPLAQLPPPPPDG